jgi:hypothetical protein
MPTVQSLWYPPRDGDQELTAYDVYLCTAHATTGELLASVERVHGHTWTRGVTVHARETEDSPKSFELDITLAAEDDTEYYACEREDASLIYLVATGIVTGIRRMARQE